MEGGREEQEREGRQETIDGGKGSGRERASVVEMRKVERGEGCEGRREGKGEVGGREGGVR